MHLNILPSYVKLQSSRLNGLAVVTDTGISEEKGNES